MSLSFVLLVSWIYQQCTNLLLRFLCCLLDTNLHVLFTFRCITSTYFYHLVLEWPCHPAATNNTRLRRKAIRLKEKTMPTTSTFSKIVTQPAQVWKFGSLIERTSTYGKRWLQDVLIFKRQVEAIRHNSKLASVSSEAWRSMYEFACSTI